MIKATDATTHGLPRPVLAAIALAVLATLVSACQRSDATQAATSPTQATAATTTPARPPPTAPSPTPTPTPPTTPSPTPDPTLQPAPTDTADATREADLEQLRASRQFLEFAEADRARHATWARFAYEYFTHEDASSSFVWTNKDDLWNSLAPRVRDECLLAGSEIVHPMWDAEVVIPAGVNPSWNDDDTRGRGYFVDFSCRHVTPEGDAAELWVGVLIEENDQRGELLQISPPIVVNESEYDTMRAAGEGARTELWNWIVTQPRRVNTND